MLVPGGQVRTNPLVTSHPRSFLFERGDCSCAECFLNAVHIRPRISARDAFVAWQGEEVRHALGDTTQGIRARRNSKRRRSGSRALIRRGLF